MSNIFRIPSDREPLIDPETGFIGKSWFLFFQDLFRRVGGATGGSGVGDSELGQDSSVASLQSMTDSYVQALSSVPPQMTMEMFIDLSAELQCQRELIAELTKEVQGIRSGTIS
jgi:hypothetical protein